MYDVVIAGSGLGGLQSAYILSKEGYSVCVLEKNSQLGGCLQTFKRNGCIFDTGMHYVGSLNENQVLWQFFKYFGLLGKLKMKRLDVDCFDLINIAGEEFKYAQGHEHFIDTLQQSFPGERKALVEYINLLKEVRSSLDDFMFSNKNIESMSRLKYFSMNTYDMIAGITPNKKLQHVLGGLNSLHGGLPETNPIYLHAIINNSLIESAWRFVDGGHYIANILAESIRAQGGVIMNNSEVVQFGMDADDQKMEYVELANKEKIYGKYFISNMHPVKTFEILKSKQIRKAYINRINSIEHTISIFSLYIVFNDNAFPYLNYNYYHNNDANPWGVKIYDDVIWPAGYMLYTPATSKSDEYADSMVVITYLKYDEMKQWENTSVEKRGEAYKEYKIMKAEKLLDQVEKRFPGIRSKIKKYYTSTPLTYRDYTGTVNGSIYGIMRDSTNPMKAFILPRTKIPNFYLTGQNTNLHGVLGVTMGSLMTCGEFVGLPYLFNKVNSL
jgi:all-trans-retinol 13,14-reductase